MVILLGEDPAETLGGLLGQARSNRHDFGVVRRIEKPVGDAQRVFHEIHHRGAVLIDEGLPRAPEQELRQTHNIAVVEERLGNAAQLWIERAWHASSAMAPRS